MENSILLPCTRPYADIGYVLFFYTQNSPKLHTIIIFMLWMKKKLNPGESK